MRLRYVPPKARLHDKVEIVLEKAEIEALASGVDLRKKQFFDGTDYTWIVIMPPANFLDKRAKPKS